jgi:D-alanine-D-alanine ligase
VAIGEVRLGVCFGGPSPEHDVSILTGLQAARELARSGRPPVALYWSRTGAWFRVDPGLEAQDFLEGVPRGAEPLRLVASPEGGFLPEGGRFRQARPLGLDVLVVCCHGGPGEDGTLQGTLDLAGLAYTGPDVAGAALGMDKLAFWGLADAAGLPVLPRRLLDAGGRGLAGLEGPFIVKPRFGGSSIGIDVVADAATALARLQANPHLRRGAVVEPYRSELFDLNVAVRRFPDLEVSAIERPLRAEQGGEILGYQDKYQGGAGMASAPRELPARIEPALAERIRELAAQVAELVGVRGVARVDFLSDGREVWVNEVNTIPGSLARYLWVEPPLAFGQLLSDLVAEAQARPTGRFSATGADGSILRSASAIAAKLA